MTLVPRSLRQTLVATVTSLLVLGAGSCVDTSLPDLASELGANPTAGRFCTPEQIDNFEPQTLRIDIIDVGQGDAIFVRTPYDDNEEIESLHVLIDTGSAGTVDGTSPGGETVVNYLIDKGHVPGRPLDAVIITHGHEDHYGGLPTVIENFDVLRYIDPGFIPGGNSFGGIRNSVTGQVTARDGVIDAPAAQALGGVPIAVDIFGPNVIAHLLWASDTPPSGNTSNPTGTDTNNTSVVVSIQYGGRRLLFMGDAEEAVEEILVEKANAGEIALVADILKVGHHGSSNSTTEAFLDAVFKDGFIDQFSHAIISSGVRSFNGTQLPTQQTMDRLKAKLGDFRVFSTESGDNEDDKPSGTEHNDDHIVVTVDEDGTLFVCYGT